MKNIAEQKQVRETAAGIERLNDLGYKVIQAI